MIVSIKSVKDNRVHVYEVAEGHLLVYDERLWVRGRKVNAGYMLTLVGGSGDTSISERTLVIPVTKIHVEHEC